MTSDEDRTVRYWQNGVNIETFVLPAQSVWSVACLGNGDIVTGSRYSKIVSISLLTENLRFKLLPNSDGVVRVFTQDESRFANEETVKTFEEEVNAVTKQSCQEIGGVKVSEYVHNLQLVTFSIHRYKYT